MGLTWSEGSGQLRRTRLGGGTLLRPYMYAPREAIMVDDDDDDVGPNQSNIIIVRSMI